MKEEIKIIDGTYKKDNPHQDIGKQKFQVKKFYNVEVDYEVVANSKEEAEDAVQEHGGIEKIEECVPYEEWDSDTDTDYLNYEDPDWTTDSYRWTKEELETSDEKVKTKESEIPF